MSLTKFSQLNPFSWPLKAALKAGSIIFRQVSGFGGARYWESISYLLYSADWQISFMHLIPARWIPENRWHCAIRGFIVITQTHSYRSRAALAARDLREQPNGINFLFLCQAQLAKTNPFFHLINSLVLPQQEEKLPPSKTFFQLHEALIFGQLKDSWGFFLLHKSHRVNARLIELFLLPTSHFYLEITIKLYKNNSTWTSTF